MPLKLREKVEDEIKRLINLNIIRPSKSTTVSRAFPVLKKDGGIRLVVDYRALNNHTMKVANPFPKMKDILAELKRKKYFTTIDLNMGYYQVPMSSESIELIAFSVHKGVFEFLRMPFGLCNTPRTFQAAMEEILKEIDCASVYLDDILISSCDFDSHVEDIAHAIDTI